VVDDRLSFRRFAGVPLAESVPDHSSVWRFREELARRGLADRLLAEVNRQLDARGLILRRGTLIDAAILEAAAEAAGGEGDGVRLVLVEDPSRFARSVLAQELGVLIMARRGVRVVTASGEDQTGTDDPAKVMMRQVAGAFAEYEKARLVRKLKGARDRRSAELGRRVEGRKGYRETNPGLAREAKRLARRNPKTGATRSLREIAGELARLGHATAAGRPFSVSQVQRLLRA
jgi:IS5 family transposase